MGKKRIASLVFVTICIAATAHSFQTPNTAQKNRRMAESRLGMEQQQSAGGERDEEWVEAKTKRRNRQHEQKPDEKEMSSMAPMYIPIGPPCSGKTTKLSNMITVDGLQLVDVSIDAEDGVYLPFPISLFLSTDENAAATEATLDRVVHGKSIRERLTDPSVMEMSLVLRRCHGVITAQQFRHKILSDDNNNDNNNNSTWQTCLVDVVESIVASDSITPIPTADLFILDALFRTPPNTANAITAVDSALSKLFHAATANATVAVAWGNTNTRPREYKPALHAAYRSHRPVVFIPFSMDESLSSHQFTLPCLTTTELIRRNICRLLESGRYLPLRQILDASTRCRTLLTDASRQTRDKLDLDVSLARLAGYQMDRRTRLVRPLAVDTSVRPEKEEEGGVRAFLLQFGTQQRSNSNRGGGGGGNYTRGGGRHGRGGGGRYARGGRGEGALRGRGRNQIGQRGGRHFTSY